MSTAAAPASTAPLRTLRPGVVGPPRPVPAGIRRPEYVGRPGASPYTGPEVKDADTIAAMRVVARLAARALAEVASHIAPGVTTDELDRVGHEFILDHGAYPSPLAYPGSGRGLPSRSPCAPASTR